jgi:hypothetical protein
MNVGQTILVIFNSLLQTTRSMRWVGHVIYMEMRNSYKILVRNPQGKRPLGRPRNGLKNNVKLHLIN